MISTILVSDFCPNSAAALKRVFPDAVGISRDLPIAAILSTTQFLKGEPLCFPMGNNNCSSWHS